MKKFLLTLIVAIAGGVFSSLYAQSFTVTGTIVDMNDAGSEYCRNRHYKWCY
jgi:hypothetical protein